MEIQGDVGELCLIQIGYHKENCGALVLCLTQETLPFQEISVHCLVVCNILHGWFHQN